VRLSAVFLWTGEILRAFLFGREVRHGKVFKRQKKQAVQVTHSGTTEAALTTTLNHKEGKYHGQIFVIIKDDR